MSDEKIVTFIRASVLAARSLGLQIDLRTYGLDTQGRVYVPNPELGHVCLIGATLLDKQRHSSSVLVDFALLVNRDLDWAKSFQDATAGHYLPIGRPGYAAARTLIDWLEMEKPDATH